MKSFIPFSTFNDNQFDISVKQGVNYILETGIIYTPIEMDKKLFDRINHAVCADQNDYDEIDTYIDCKYYGVEDFQKLKIKPEKSFSVFHLKFTLYKLI